MYWGDGSDRQGQYVTVYPGNYSMAFVLMSTGTLQDYATMDVGFEHLLGFYLSLQ
jgi:hypothetical protein